MKVIQDKTDFNHARVNIPMKNMLQACQLAGTMSPALMSSRATQLPEEPVVVRLVVIKQAYPGTRAETQIV